MPILLKYIYEQDQLVACLVVDKQGHGLLHSPKDDNTSSPLSHKQLSYRVQHENLLRALKKNV